MPKQVASPKNDEGKENTDITQQPKHNMTDDKTNDNDSHNNNINADGEPLKPKALVTQTNPKETQDESTEEKKEQDQDPQKQETTVAAGSPNKKRKHNQGESASAAPPTDDDEDETADNEEEETNAEESDAKPKAVPFDLTQPIKRARTAYFIFSDEYRAEIQAKHKGEGVAVVARELGQMWGNLDPKAKEKYQEKAAMERERVAKQVEQLKEAGVDLSKLPGAAQPNDSSGNNNNNNTVIFPAARIRKICKLDPEVRNLSKEALLLVTKCAELATAKLGMETVLVAQIQNRRKLLPEDIAQVCATREQFLFLNDDVKDLMREQVTQKQQKEKEGSEGGEGKVSKKATAAASNTKPLTAFFSAK